MRRPGRPVALLALALALPIGLLAATGSPAAAATRTVEDRRGDAGPDLTRVTVRWFDGLTVTAAHARPIRQSDLFTAYVDTRPGNPGPEFRAFAQPNSDVVGLRRVDAWFDRGRAVRCPGLRVSADAFTPRAPVRFFVPAGCLGAPQGAVRVTVRSQRGGASDWSPAARTLGPSVRRG